MTARAAVAALLLAHAAPAAEFRTGQPVMGTILQVTVIADDTESARQAAEASFAEAKRWDDLLTTWRPDGELALLNDRAGSGDVAVSAALHDALEEMNVLVHRTGGAFDPAVGAVLASRTEGRLGATIGPALFATSLKIGRTAIAKLAEGARLDAGAIGKGMALDAVAKLLRERGVEAAFLDFGGSSHLAIGAPPDSPEGWVVAITGLETGSVRGTVSLRDGALSTSRTPSALSTDTPVIDPRDGRPVSQPRAVTVWHRRATDADAWSTALIVLGRAGIGRARSEEVEVFLEDPNGIVTTTAFPLERFER